MDKSFNIMGIDPGSRNVGVSIFNVLPEDDNHDIKFTVNKVLTFSINIDIEDDVGIHELILDRLKKLSNIIKTVYRLYNPTVVAMESAFINTSRMGAVIPLAQAIYAIQSTIYSIDRSSKVITLPPGLIKKIFGSKQVGKDAVLVALKSHKLLMEKITKKNMTDHEIDAIAIAYSILEYIKTTRGMVCIKYLEI